MARASQKAVHAATKDKSLIKRAPLPSDNQCPTHEVECGADVPNDACSLRGVEQLRMIGWTPFHLRCIWSYPSSGYQRFKFQEHGATTLRCVEHGFEE